MTVVDTFREGARRAARAPAVLIGTLVLNLLVAAPLAYVLRGTIAAHFGASQMADDALREMNTDWWGELHERQAGLGATLTPSVIGFAVVLRNVSDLLDAEAPDARLIGPIATWLVLWTFLAGGIIDRYARNGPLHAQGFFGTCGHHVFRLLRLGLLSGAAYVILFSVAHPLLFDTIYGALTDGLAVQRTAFFIRLALYLLFGLLLMAVHIVTDVTRVRAVVEDRRSMIGAGLAACRLIAARWRTVLGLYGLAAAGLFVLWLLYALIAPSGRGGGAWVWLALLTGQLYLLGRLWLKLQILASLVTMYQADLGRQEEAAATTTTPVWPESPAADIL